MCIEIRRVAIWSSLNFVLGHGLAKVLDTQVCLVVADLLHIIGSYLKNYLLWKTIQINTQKKQIFDI
jgi:hypothetical protein